MTHLLFSYGTLQLDSVQTAIWGGPIAGEADAVVGYELGEVVIDDPAVIEASGSSIHPGLIPSDDPTSTVAGVVFVLTEEQLAAADDYEIHAYTRVAYPLSSGRTAWVYAIAP